MIDSNGRKISERESSSVDKLCGIGSDFVIFKKDNHFSLYNRH